MIQADSRLNKIEYNRCEMNFLVIEINIPKFLQLVEPEGISISDNKIY